MANEPTTRDLERQLKAAQLVREQVASMADNDPDLIRDSIEGETSLFEIMSAMVAADGEDEALVEAISAYVKTLNDRKSRVEKRIDVRRALMASAMEVAELPKLETAAGTVSRKAVAPKVIIIEESEIPSRFFVAQAPKLDKTVLGKALKERAAALAAIKAEPGSAEYAEAKAAADKEFPEVSGAVLSNGGATIQIRK